MDTHANTSLRDATIDMMDRIQVAETCAGHALAAWSKTCKIPELRGGLKMIAEREAYHGRVLQQRIHDLGGECKVELDPFSQQSEAVIANPALTDLEKLTDLVERNGDPTTLIAPVLAFADMLADDVESAEILRLYYADEISSGNWLRDLCHKLSGDGVRHAA